MCCKKHLVFTESSSLPDSNAQLDTLYCVLPEPSRTIGERRTSAVEILTIFVHQTAGITNWLNTVRTLINDNEMRLAELDFQRPQYEAEQEQRGAAGEAEREKRADAWKKIGKQHNVNTVKVNFV